MNISNLRKIWSSGTTCTSQSRTLRLQSKMDHNSDALLTGLAGSMHVLRKYLLQSLNDEYMIKPYYYLS